MPVIVLAVSGRNVLVAEGGRWLEDKEREATWKPYIRSKQIFPSDERSAMTSVAARRAAEATARSLGDDIHFTPLVWSAEKRQYSTRFLYPANPPGFIKGTFPDLEHPRELAIVAALREFKEETGYCGSEFPIYEIRPTIFRMDIPDNQDIRDDIIARWRALGIERELSDLRWESISDIKRDMRVLNMESQGAVQYLPNAGGRRKTRRRKGRSRAKRICAR